MGQYVNIQNRQLGHMANNPVFSYLESLRMDKDAVPDFFLKPAPALPRFTPPLVTTSGSRSSDSLSAIFASNSSSFISIPSTPDPYSGSPSPPRASDWLNELLNKIQRLSDAQTPEECQKAVAFFTPYMLQHWQLSQLNEVLRCSIKRELPHWCAAQVLKREPFKSDIESVIALHNVLIIHVEEQYFIGFCDNSGEYKQEKLNLTPEELGLLDPYISQDAITDTTLQNKINQILLNSNSRSQLKNPGTSDFKDHLEAALVLSSLLDVIYHECMSAPWLSERTNPTLAQQQKEYRDFLNLFHHTKVINRFPYYRPVRRQNIFEWGHLSFWFTGLLHWTITTIRDPILSVIQIQWIFATFNPFRLGLFRLRRLASFIGPALHNQTMIDNFTYLENHGMRTIFLYISWLFFAPRLTLNLVLLAHHLFNDSNLTPIERTFDRSLRFRAHWMRFWQNIINDLYWFSNGIAFCFLLSPAYPVLSLGIGLAAQLADLVMAIIIAVVEIRRMNIQENAINELDEAGLFDAPLRARIVFEQKALAYNIFHFWMLLIALCCTLPSMVAISPLLPVVGGTIAVLMTVITFLFQHYNEQDSQKNHRIGNLVINPKDAPSLPRLNSTLQIG